MTGSVSRTNHALNPRAVISGANSWPTTRGFGPGGAGSYIYAVGVPAPAGTEVSTARRKLWTVAPTSVAGSGFLLTADGAAGFPVVAGDTYVCSVYTRVAVGPSRVLWLRASWRDAAGAVVGSDLVGPTVQTSGTAWLRLSQYFTAPAGAVTMLLEIELPATTGAGLQWNETGTYKWNTLPAGATWLDPKITDPAPPVPQVPWQPGDTFEATGLLIERTAAGAAGSYFDGNTSDTDALRYDWTGSPHASRSTVSVLAALVGASCDVWINGVRYPDGCYAYDPTGPAIVSGLSIRWGRTNTIDQPQPAICTFTIRDPDTGPRYDSGIGLGSQVLVYGAVYGGSNLGVFSGRVTDLDTNYADGAAWVEVTAVDQLSELASRFVGTEPWPAEVMSARASRILTAVGVNPGILRIPSRPAALPISRMDVDRQTAAGLLYDLARSTNSLLSMVLYNDGTVAMRFEDPTARASMVRFTWNGTAWGPAEGGSPNQLDACLILSDPVHWQRDVTDILTRVTVRWQDQTTSPGTTERSVSVVDAGAETAYGSRGVSIGTDLTDSTNATNLANLFMASHAPSDSWRASGLVWDTGATPTRDEAARAIFGTILDSVTRAGVMFSLMNLPDWTPTTADTTLYTEGGTYVYRDGYWVLSLVASPSATGQGESMTFATTPTAPTEVRYDNLVWFLKYSDMIGVAPP